jgi:hypothetical protein
MYRVPVGNPITHAGGGHLPSGNDFCPPKSYGRNLKRPQVSWHAGFMAGALHPGPVPFATPALKMMVPDAFKNQDRVSYLLIYNDLHNILGT